MERPAIWKALTLGAIVTGLGIGGAGAALAGSGIASADAGPVVADWPFDDLDDLDDLLQIPLQVPTGYVLFDDDWDDWGDDWHDD
jgi:hypothetical protein